VWTREADHLLHRPPIRRRSSGTCGKIKFDGTGLKRITTTPGRHQINMSPNTQFFIDTYSSTTPAEAGRPLVHGERRQAAHARVEHGRRRSGSPRHAYSPLELFSFTTSDGVKIDASMIKPPGFDPSKKYPVVFTIYGGPAHRASTTSSRRPAGRSGSRRTATSWSTSTIAARTTTAATS
jgi:dipeptidyl aminopeptidase/acylaminoacyl peptidase